MEKIDWVYYLHLTSKLNHNYLALDNQLKAWDLSLVPLHSHDIMNSLKQLTKIHLVCLIENRVQRDAFVKQIKSINYLINTGKVHFFLFSSFSDVLGLIEKKNKNFHYHPLPIGRSQACDIIIKSIAQNYGQDKKWPGGSRVRRVFETLNEK